VSERLFTLHEANALIPKLSMIIEKLQRHSRALQREVQEVAEIAGQRPEDLTTAALLEWRPPLQPTVDEVQQLLEEIRVCGAHFKGLELGLIDFPAELEGEVVFLCWQYGEREIAYYHTIEAGFAGRKPLDGRQGRARYLQ
jgi:hypothetical protein